MKFTTRGYITVYKGDEYVSRHRVETEAVESAFRNGPGEYAFFYPIKTVEVPDREDIDSYWPQDYWSTEGQGDHTRTELMDAAVNVTVLWNENTED